MALKVIGAGFGRTGTESMRAALEILGLGPCHHMRAVHEDDAQKAMWRAVAAGGPRDWDRLLAGFASSLDWPSAAYWRELAAAYPEATVLLTRRDAESWWRSFSATILPLIEQSEDPASLGVALIAEQVFGGRPGDREHAIAVYRANQAAVLAEIPAGRLVVHDLGAGWAPLCAPLGLPVPDVPFPHTNTGAEFRADPRLRPGR